MGLPVADSDTLPPNVLAMILAQARGQLASQPQRLAPQDTGPISGDIGGALPEGYQDPNVGLGSALKNTATRLAMLPQQAIQNAQFDLNTGYYDPGPTLQAATLPIGTGAIASVPIKGAVGGAKYADDMIDLLTQGLQSSPPKGRQGSQSPPFGALSQ